MPDLSQINPNLLTAVIAAVTSFFTLFVTELIKNQLASNLLKNKLKTEHLYAQQKAIKDVLARFKTHILDSSEWLHRRLINLSKHHASGWQTVNGDYENMEHYYFTTFTYRFMRLFAWMRLVKKELIFLDTTIASKEDLDFVKFMKLLEKVLQDSDLFVGFPFSTDSNRDYLLHDRLEEMSHVLIENNEVLTYSQFKEVAGERLSKYRSLCTFLDGIRPDENRLRWDRLFCFHLVLICFINTYGYDYQRVSDVEIKRIADNIQHPKLLDNLVELLAPYKINEHSEWKRMWRVMKT